MGQRSGVTGKGWASLPAAGGLRSWAFSYKVEYLGRIGATDGGGRTIQEGRFGPNPEPGGTRTARPSAVSLSETRRLAYCYALSPVGYGLASARRPFRLR